MINIPELRIGNFCLASKKSSEISLINESNKLSALDKIRAHISGKDKTVYQVFSLNKSGSIEVLNLFTKEVVTVQAEEIYPIRLTSKILSDCGFKEKTFTSNDWVEKYLTIDENVPIRISEYRQQTCFAIYVFDKKTISNAFLREIRYLHQLQNLYFELTAHNLEVELNHEKEFTSLN